MTRKQRVLGIAVGIFAVTAVAATPASARIVHDFEAASAPYIVTGTQIGAGIAFEFGAGGGTLKCAQGKLNGTIKSSPGESLTVQPTHEECTLGGLAATVDKEGCNYVFEGETDALEHANVTIECSGVNKPRITVTGCTIEIEKLGTKKGVHYTNTEKPKEKKDVDAEVTTENGLYTATGLLCGAIVGNGGDLSVTGTYTIGAYKDKEGVEGEQIDFKTKETVLP